MSAQEHATRECRHPRQYARDWFFHHMGNEIEWDQCDEIDLAFIGRIAKLNSPPAWIAYRSDQGAGSDLYTQWLLENGYHADDDRTDKYASFIYDYFHNTYLPFAQTDQGREAIAYEMKVDCLPLAASA